MIDNAILRLTDPSPCRFPSPESHRDGDESEATISEPKGNERHPDLLGGEQGIASVQLVGKAIGTVAKVVVGVAAGVPGAGLWALPVLGPAILYLAATSDSTTTIVPFAVWSLIVSFSDAVLKPMLMGRGTEIPVAVILIGAIGGLIPHRLIGLFLGAVVFSTGYLHFGQWMKTQGSSRDGRTPAARRFAGRKCGPRAATD